MAPSIQNTSQSFRERFLLTFTKELIRNSKIEEFEQLQTVLKKKKPKDEFEVLEEEYEEMIPSLMHREPIRNTEPLRQPLFTSPPKPLPLPKKRLPQQRPPPRQTKITKPKGSLIIPEHPLPSTVRNIRPMPNESHSELDLGRITPFINNPSITNIECNGPEEPIVLKGAGGTQNTNINLSKEEIDHIINEFSEASKIPIHEGVSKIVVGRLILSAIVSEVIGSKFIIRKIPIQKPTPRPGMPPKRMGLIPSHRF
jgi:hypothetical protein